MQKAKTISARQMTVKALSVALMFFCLTFLTCINYFLYPAEQQTSSWSGSDGDDNTRSSIPPSGPTEEKSSSSGVSILEEFLHDPHPVIHFGIDSQPHLHGIANVDGVLVYHGELLSPPPEL